MIDEYGHCIKCGKDLMVWRNGKKEPSAYYASKAYYLNNGSKMNVCMCKDCQKTTNTTDWQDIMQGVKAGWTNSMDTLNWSQEKRDKYNEYYGELNITGEV